MSDNNDSLPQPTQQTPQSNGRSALRIAQVSCLLILILATALIISAAIMFFRNPTAHGIIGEAKTIAQCQINMQEIGGALDRYSRRNDHYPAKLDDLYPMFLEKKDILHCPSVPDTTEYDYIQPSADADPKTAVITCKRHIIMKDQGPWILILQKDGKVIRLTPSITTPPGVSGQPKSKGENR